MSADPATRIFEALRTSGFDGVGITRECYADSESRALDIVEAEARDLGLSTERDAAANLWATLPGAEPDMPFVACGSHMDTIPQGGNFDGAAGVVGGLVALGGLRIEGFRPRRSIRVLALRGEESAFFGRAYLGSSALLGKLTPQDLAQNNAHTGRSLRECMRAAGAEVDRIARGEKLLDPAAVACWLELHIEQGPVLTTRNLPVAIVTGIRGNIRHRAVECLGEAGHSGAVPRWLRHDSVFAVAELLTRLDRHWARLLEEGRDLVVTSGILGTDPHEHALARIPGRVTFSLDIRSQSRETMAAFYELFETECRAVAGERGVEFRRDCRLETAPAQMDERLVAFLRSKLWAAGLIDEPMPSGAGHDAAVFANAGVPTGMIFVRNEHGSHNPGEAMDIDDFMIGVEILKQTLRELAG
jgi:beta-ureidopropionase / N-carbamoyl-L-amino-acid hydrolase